MRPLPLAVSIAAVLSSASALAAPPTQPGDLRADVYSGTAAELFWSRSSDPDGAVRAYEIRRDGELVATIDGLSYFTDTLSDGQASAFTITAIDFDGERSAPASVSVVGGDREGAVGAGGGRPTPPTNLTSSVYSSSAAEVFWDRSDQSGLTYEVAVDGGPVLTTSGTSAFLSGLDSARGRGVDVVAIDANGQRSGAANVTLGGSGGGDPTPPVSGDAPAAPAGLRGELYSSSAGEVFWDRVPGSNLSYEVSVGGEVVATTDGTSYFIEGPSGLGGTSIAVVAISADGARSGVSSTTLGSGGPSIPDPGSDTPPAPANARIEVYSDTAAELFFDRAPVGANVARTEVARDGIIIGEISGTSFFDERRSPGEIYRYTLVSISDSGRRSSGTVVGGADAPTATSPGSEFSNLLERPADDSPLSIENSEDFLPAIVTVANAEPLEAIRAAFNSINGRAEDNQLEVFSTDGTATTYACDGGGRFTTAPRDLGRAFGSIIEYEISDCVSGGSTLNGGVTLVSFTGEPEYTYEGVSLVSNAGVRLSFDGTNQSVISAGNARDRQNIWMGDWEVSGDGVALEVSNFETVVVADFIDADSTSITSPTRVPVRRLTSSFVISGSFTSDVPLSASTPTAFVSEGDDEYYDVGRFVVSAPNGSVLTLRADTGDVNTLGLTFDNGTSASDVTTPWRPDIRFAYGTLP